MELTRFYKDLELEDNSLAILEEEFHLGLSASPEAHPQSYYTSKEEEFPNGSTDKV